MSEGTILFEGPRPKKARKKVAVKRGPGRPPGGAGHKQGGLRRVLLESKVALWTAETLASLGKTTKESARETLRRAVAAGWMKRDAQGFYKLTRRKP